MQGSRRNDVLSHKILNQKTPRGATIVQAILPQLTLQLLGLRIKPSRENTAIVGLPLEVSLEVLVAEENAIIVQVALVHPLSVVPFVQDHHLAEDGFLSKSVDGVAWQHAKYQRREGSLTPCACIALHPAHSMSCSSQPEI